VTTTNIAIAQPGDLFIDTASTLTRSFVERAINSSGVRGFMKYTPYSRSTPTTKFWTTPEINLVHECGGYIMSNWEIEAERPLKGYPTGYADGSRNRAAMRALGYPDQVAIPCSVDMNTLSSNFNQVHGFLRGHFQTDGEGSINMAYMDTDGGRATADITQAIWIPGAFGWSPELFSYNLALKALGLSQEARNWKMAEKAEENPQAYAIQFPSGLLHGLHVDRNVVLKPFKVWGPTVTIPDPPVIKPPEVVKPPVINIPTNPIKEKDMEYIVSSPTEAAVVRPNYRADGSVGFTMWGINDPETASVLSGNTTVISLSQADFDHWKTIQDPK
jgi:hypothetical protein